MIETLKLLWLERKYLIAAALILGLAIWIGDLYLTRAQARGDAATCHGQLIGLQTQYDALVAADKALADASTQAQNQAAPAVAKAAARHLVVQPVIDTLDATPTVPNSNPNGCEQGVDEAKKQLNKLGGAN